MKRQGVYTVRDFLHELLFGSGLARVEQMTSAFKIGRFANFDAFLGDVTTPENAPLLKGALNLVQFVKITYRPSVGDLVEFFSRGLGVIAKVNEEAVDLYLPVVLDQDVEVHDSGAAAATAWNAASASAAKGSLLVSSPDQGAQSAALSAQGPPREPVAKKGVTRKPSADVPSRRVDGPDSAPPPPPAGQKAENAVDLGTAPPT
jgi:uncharacterized protein YkvS